MRVGGALCRGIKRQLSLTEKLIDVNIRIINQKWRATNQSRT
jgi:hypothetical protein